MLLAPSPAMGTEDQRRASVAAPGEDKIVRRSEGNAEGVQDDSSNEASVTDTDVANAADEAGSAFLPHDKVLSNPAEDK